MAVLHFSSFSKRKINKNEPGYAPVKQCGYVHNCLNNTYNSILFCAVAIIVKGQINETY